MIFYHVIALAQASPDAEDIINGTIAFVRSDNQNGVQCNFLVM